MANCRIFLQYPINRRTSNFERPRNRRERVTTGSMYLPGHRYLLIIELGPPAAHPAANMCGVKTSDRALANDVSLKLSDGNSHMEINFPPDVVVSNPSVSERNPMLCATSVFTTSMRCYAD